MESARTLKIPMSSNDPHRIWRTAFFASVVLNVFLVSALVATVFLAYRTLGVWPTSSPEPGAVRSGLTPTEREGFRRVLRESRAEIGPMLSEAGDARRAARTLLLQPDFDRPATELALARSRKIEAELKVAVDRVMLDFVATLPAERRIAVADTLRPGRRVFDLPKPIGERRDADDGSSSPQR